MTKKPSFRPDFGPFVPNLGHQILFSRIWIRQSIDIMISYHHVQYQKKTNDPIFRQLSEGWTGRRTGGPE